MVSEFRAVLDRFGMNAAGPFTIPTVQRRSSVRVSGSDRRLPRLVHSVSRQDQRSRSVVLFKDANIIISLT